MTFIQPGTIIAISNYFAILRGALMTTKDVTKQKLKEAIKTLLLSKSFEKITIADIVQSIDISRQSFYAHYPDKYALICDIHDDVLQKSLKKIGYDLSWAEGVYQLYSLMKDNAPFYTKIFKGYDNNFLYEYHLKTVMDTYERIIDYQNQFCDEAKFSLELYCRGAVSMIVKWVTTGMKETPDELISLYFYTMPPIIKKALIDSNNY